MSEKDQILADLERLRAGFRERFSAAKTEQALRDENAKILGKSGELTAILKLMGKVAPEDRKLIGGKTNELKGEVEKAFNDALAALANAKRRADLEAPPFDLTLPGREPAPRGHAHVISIVRDEIVEIFEQMGFAVFDGPEIDTAANNFDRLGFPPDHPATDMHDTFYTKQGHLLRTHTSNIQVRAMSSQKPPFAFIAPGACYRVDNDITHSPMFHQVEAFLVDENVSLAHLKGVLAEFAERFYGKGTPVRLRPSYFPFVEPGAEVDIGCVFCKGAGCNVCKHSGFIEVLGCGMIDPRVFTACGIDPEKWTGFALGMGVERQAMLRYRIPNVGLLFENDPRFLEQFG
ncbi:MAG TPA: phenylalanine--tRNA ligase subunit alpha [Polyangiaceae bacterium]|jgi:phenylalanyl-tRNA synthetase alpha chain|nr:phenylalanine--tRNA ligase subunit alpha [Polyangiaceae bacterium]